METETKSISSKILLTWEEDCIIFPRLASPSTKLCKALSLEEGMNAIKIGRIPAIHAARSRESRIIVEEDD